MVAGDNQISGLDSGTDQHAVLEIPMAPQLCGGFGPFCDPTIGARGNSRRGQPLFASAFVFPWLT